MSEHRAFEVGQKVGHLTLLQSEVRKEVRHWHCRCDCGRLTTKRASCIRRSPLPSCGCKTPGLISKAARKHGMTVGRRTPEYSSWVHMNRRCNSPSNTCYKNYGRRGITICERWQSFENFLADMGNAPSPKHTLDRINVNGNYEPSNCRWATKLEQDNNKRGNVRLTLNGRTMTIAQWNRELGMSTATVQTRLKRGWTVEEALTIPVQARSK